MTVAGDEDATTEAAFKNVPRRRRSAGAASSSGPAPWPPKEEQLGGDDPGRGAPLPPAPSRDGGAEPHIRRAEKRRRLEDAKNGGGGGGAPPAAAAAAEWFEKERIRKGKMPAAMDASRPAISGGGKKLMGDAIRCHGGSAKNKKNPKSKKRKAGLGPPFWYGMGRDGQSTSTAGSPGTDQSFESLAGGVASAGLRAALANVGAGAPVRVYGRLMSGCDRNTHQSRLQMSCKSWRATEDGEYPVCAFLEAAEKAAAHGEGLLLKAYDRRGEEYELKLRYLRCNNSYRLISKWGHLLRSNGLVVDKGGGCDAEPVMLELWLFRPPRGAVGMVVLHYYKGDAAHADAALEEEEGRRRAKGRRMLVDNAMENVAGDKNGKGEGSAAATAASPSSEPGGGVKAAAEPQQACGGAMSEVAEAALSPDDAAGTKAQEKEAAPSSSDAAGGAAMVVEEEEGGAAPGEADGTKTVEEKDASATPMEVAAAQSASSPPDAGGAAGKKAGAPGEEAASPPPADASDGAKKAASRFGLTLYECFAAYALVQLSQS
ncbi:unnamed protein product [Urochloa humidicola]